MKMTPQETKLALSALSKDVNLISESTSFNQLLHIAYTLNCLHSQSKEIETKAKIDLLLDLLERNWLDTIKNKAINRERTPGAPESKLTFNFNHKSDLQELRSKCKQQLGKIEDTRKDFAGDIQAVYQKTTLEIQTLLSRLILESLQSLGAAIGTPPCDFAFIGFGSYARREMTLFSDIDFGILLSDDKEEHKIYFRKLTLLLMLKLLRLGETNAATIGKEKTDNDMNNGIAFDGLLKGARKIPFGAVISGDSPKGKERYVIRSTYTKSDRILFELISTPEQLAQYQNPSTRVSPSSGEKSESKADKSLFTDADVNSLINTWFLPISIRRGSLICHGRKEVLGLDQSTRESTLLARYNVAVKKQRKEYKNFKQQSLHYLRHDLSKYGPDMLEHKTGANKKHYLLSVQHDLYRLILMITQHLCDFYNLPMDNIWHGIKQLSQFEVNGKRIFPVFATHSLTNTVSRIMYHRYNLYVKFGEQNEEALMTTPLNVKGSLATPMIDEKEVIALYGVLIPLYEAARLFSENDGDDISGFQSDATFQDSWYVKATIELLFSRNNRAAEFYSKFFVDTPAAFENQSKTLKMQLLDYTISQKVLSESKIYRILKPICQSMLFTLITGVKLTDTDKLVAKAQKFFSANKSYPLQNMTCLKKRAELEYEKSLEVRDEGASITRRTKALEHITKALKIASTVAGTASKHYIACFSLYSKVKPPEAFKSNLKVLSIPLPLRQYQPTVIKDIEERLEAYKIHQRLQSGLYNFDGQESNLVSILINISREGFVKDAIYAAQLTGVLLKNGVDPNCMHPGRGKKTGVRPLHVAAHNGNWRVAKRLMEEKHIEADAIVDNDDSNMFEDLPSKDLTAADIARLKGHEKLASAIESNSFDKFMEEKPSTAPRP